MAAGFLVHADDDSDVHFLKYQVSCEAKNAVLKINQFKVEIKNGDWDSTLAVLALKKGINKIAITTSEGKVKFMIQEYLGAGKPLKTLFKIELKVPKTGESIISFDLPNFSYKWSWLKSKTSKGHFLPYDDVEKLKKLSDYYVRAHINRSFDDKFRELLKYEFKDYASLVGFDSKSVFSTYKDVFSQVFSPNHYKKLDIPHSPFIVSSYDNHIVKVVRKDGVPIYIVHEENGKVFVKNVFYFIKIDGKWYVYYCS